MVTKGVQVNASDKEKNVRVNSGTELHISKAIVGFRHLTEPHQGLLNFLIKFKNFFAWFECELDDTIFLILADCSVGIGVRYEEDCCDCHNVRRHLGEHCALHPQQNRQCIVGVIKPEKKSEADLDLNFVGGQNLTFYYTYHCTCTDRPYVVVNLSGYLVSH